MGNTVKIGAFKKTTEVELPSVKGAKVVIRTTRTVAEQNALRSKYKNLEDSKHEDSKNGMLEMVVSSIVSWNIEKDDSEELLEITNETVKGLPELDVMFLLGEATGQTLVKDGKMLTKEQIEKGSKNA